MQTNKIVLRPPQERQVAAIAAAFNKGYRKILAQLPTGGGKTVEFAYISGKYYENTNKSVLIIVNRIELLNQAAKTIEEITGIKPSLITSDDRHIRQAPIYVGMAKSLINRMHLMYEVGLVIIDECHIAEFNKFHEIYNEELILGFTATPKSSSKKFPLKDFYEEIITGASIKSLIENGFLSQNITRCPKEIVNKSLLKISSTGEYDIGQMAEAYINPKYVINTFLAYKRYSKGKKTLVFNVNVEHSLEVLEAFTISGVNARHIDATMGDNVREETIEWFRKTKDAVLMNVGITNFGFDVPDIDTVIVNRATTSLPLWLQMCGRGARIVDEQFISRNQKNYDYPLEIKTFFTIIDMGGNAVTHGDWCDDRDWGYIFHNPELPANGVAPVKICPSCQGMIHAAKIICDLKNPDGTICGHVFDRKKYREEIFTQEMSVVTKNIDIKSMIEKNESRKNYKVFFDIGTELIGSMHEKNIELTDEQVRDLLVKYLELSKQWFTMQYPNKVFSLDWHKRLATNHFMNLLKQNYQYEKQTA